MIRLNREFKILEDYTSKLEKVVFKGYQKEAEVFLNAKLNIEDFEIFKADILKEKEKNSKIFEEHNEIFKNMKMKINGLNTEIISLKSQLADAEENKHVTIEYTDIDSEGTIDFSDLDYNNITNIPMPHLAKRVLKPMYKEIEKMKKEMTDNMADMLNDKDVETSKRMSLLAQQNQEIKKKVEEALSKIQDLNRENQIQNEKAEGKLTN